MGSHFMHGQGAHFKPRHANVNQKHKNVIQPQKCSNSQANRFTFASIWFTFRLLFGCANRRGMRIGMGMGMVDWSEGAGETSYRVGVEG